MLSTGMNRLLIRICKKSILCGKNGEMLSVLRPFSSRHDDGFISDSESGFGQSWSRTSANQRHFKEYRDKKERFSPGSLVRREGGFRKRRSRRFDPFDDLEDDFGDNNSYFRGRSIKGTSFEKDVGDKLKEKDWDSTKLVAVEKNFYVEHQSVADRPQSEIDDFYTRHNITVSKGERPLPVSNFHEANFPDPINKYLEKNAWSQPTPIQSLGWPLTLSGKNVVGIAQTGSGKTLAFILPALIHIKHQRQVKYGEGPIVLVLAPTRELAQQIKSVAVEYGRLLGIQTCAVFGGQSKLVQARQLSRGPDIVVATPGRLLDFLEMEVSNLDRTTYVVLDEADRMLDMGFEPQIRKVLSQVRPDRQILMWSATWPKEIQQLARDFLGDFSQVNIGALELSANKDILQQVHVCESREKFGLLLNTLENQDGEKTLIFTQTKTRADMLTHKLRNHRFKALAIHGDKSQMVRDKALDSFREGTTQILVATDVASRGLDVSDIKLVVNFDFPTNIDAYIHRIGRTGRASKSGTAVSFVTDNDAGQAKDLIQILKQSGQEISADLEELADLHKKCSRKGPNKPRPVHSQRPRPYRSGGFQRRNSW